MGIKIKTKVFEGPLDLLLHLIEKNKVSIMDIPISFITDQYMEYIEEMEIDRLDATSEFVQMAATLISIKAKMLLPKKNDENDEYIDPRRELMEQLLEYKKYKLMSEELKKRQDLAKKVCFKKATIPDEILEYVPECNPDDLLQGIDFSQLYSIFNKLMKKNRDKIDPIRSEFGEIKSEVFSIQDKMEEILELKSNVKKFRFSELITVGITKAEMISMFLAVLELIKTSKIRVFQNKLFLDIDIEFIS